MILLIDDFRDINADVIARNYKAGELLLGMKIWDELWLDHDLGEGKTGYDLAKWAIDHNVMPSKVRVVTLNPVGRKNINGLLVDSGWKYKGGVVYEKKD